MEREDPEAKPRLRREKPVEVGFPSLKLEVRSNTRDRIRPICISLLFWIKNMLWIKYIFKAFEMIQNLRTVHLMQPRAPAHTVVMFTT
jgi:hypothetical protein